MASSSNWTVLLGLPLLLLFISQAESGGKTLSPQESRQFLSLFNRICSSQTPKQEGNTYYFCKQPETPTIQLQLTHEAEVNPSETPKQVIFVQSPNYEYTHNVALQGSAGSPQQTEIYVLPPDNSHKLQLNDLRAGVKEASKPSLYYLSDDKQQGSGLGGSSGSNSGAAAIIPIRGNNGGFGSSDNQRPSSPPLPPSNNPGVVSGGYQSYGVPSINPRNQRNVYVNANVRGSYRV